MAFTIPLLATPIRPRNARPEQVTVTDPAHPLYGRTFVLVSLTRAPGPGSCAQVAYQGDIMLKIPIEATSLRPAAPSIPVGKLTLRAIQELVRLATRDEPPDPGRLTTLGPKPTSRRARRHRPSGGEP